MQQKNFNKWRNLSGTVVNYAKSGAEIQFKISRV